MMGSVGPVDLIVVLALALLFFGPGRLPALGRDLGRAVREFMNAFSGAAGSGAHSGRRAGSGHGRKR
jgi:TatA/E family protein of Tat protein translocase